MGMGTQTLLRPQARSQKLLDTAKVILAETLWPTRCAICDKLGAVLCDECCRALPYVDYWRACPRCGAPWGRVQCANCNTHMLTTIGIDAYPLAQLVCATTLTAETHRIVTVYKDQGERRLARDMAAIMAAYVPPGWMAAAPVVCSIPATAKALTRRGFDHGQLLATTLAELIGRPWQPLLRRPETSDQRKLKRSERLANMVGNLALDEGQQPPRAVIVVDDVSTTGATMIAAALGLLSGGVKTVYGLTFTTTA